MLYSLSLLLCFLLLREIRSNSNRETTPQTIVGANICKFYGELSPAIRSILCAVEVKEWLISAQSTAMIQAGCLLGRNKCDEVLSVPKQDDVPPSPAPKQARNRKYQELAETAESLVPNTWWREVRNFAFANCRELLFRYNNYKLVNIGLSIREVAIDR